jgi:hypothetical protein
MFVTSCGELGSYVARDTVHGDGLGGVGFEADAEKEISENLKGILEPVGIAGADGAIVGVKQG